jgi:hypothetical protein
MCLTVHHLIALQWLLIYLNPSKIVFVVCTFHHATKLNFMVNNQNDHYRSISFFFNALYNMNGSVSSYFVIIRKYIA